MTPLQNAFQSPRTSFASIGSILLGALLQDALPKIVAYLTTGAPGQGWHLVGLFLGSILGVFFMSDTKKPAPGTLTSQSGRIDVALLLALMLALTLGACAYLKGSSVSGTVSGKQADVTIMAPNGSAYGILVANQQACVSGAPFVALPGSTLLCQPACGALVAGGATVTVNCKVAGSAQVFPIMFAIPVKG